ncbi:MAG: tetratricopeptide repeat protein [Phycisphaerales bacterium]
MSTVQTVRLSRREAELQRESRATAQTVETLRQMISAAAAASAAHDAEPVQAMLDGAVKRLETQEAEGGDLATLNQLWREVAAAAHTAQSMGVFGRAVEVGLPQAEKLWGRRNVRTADWITFKGLERENRNDLSAARACYAEALEIVLAVAGEKDPQASRAANNLGGILRRQGEYEAAEKMLLRALEMRKAVYGERHETVATTLRNLASNDRDWGRYDLSEERYNEALASLPDGNEQASSGRLAIMHNYGRLLRDLKRYEDCLKLCDESLKVIESVRGPRSTLAARFHQLKVQVFSRKRSTPRR